MKDSDEDVARALRMLVQAPPPEGMEARIVRRMRERQAEVSARPVVRGAARWAFASAVAGAAVVAGLLSLHRPHPVKPLPVLVDTNHAAGASGEAAMHRADVAASVPRPRWSGLRGLQTHNLEPSQHVELSHNAPPLPLTQQEQLLLALAQRPGDVTGLGSVTATEVVVDHGVGKNAIFELDHEELAQLKTTLQLTPLKNTLPQLIPSGDTE